MHAHEMTSRMTFASAKKGAPRSVQPAAAKAPRSWRSSTVMVFRSQCTWPAASPYEPRLVPATLDARFFADLPTRLIGDRGYDSDRVDDFFAWLHHSRRAVTRWEYHVDNFLGMITLTCARMLLSASMR